MLAFARYCAEFGQSRKVEAGLLVRLQVQGVVFGDVPLFVVLDPSMGGIVCVVWEQCTFQSAVELFLVYLAAVGTVLLYQEV